MTEDKQRAYEVFKSQNWYKLWKKNFGVSRSWRGRKTIQAYLQATEIAEWINYSMSWDRTLQGHDYWSYIHAEWWSKYNDYRE